MARRRGRNNRSWRTRGWSPPYRKERGEKRQQEKECHSLPEKREIETACGIVWGEKDEAMELANELFLQDRKVVVSRMRQAKIQPLR